MIKFKFILGLNLLLIFFSFAAQASDYTETFCTHSMWNEVDNTVNIINDRIMRRMAELQRASSFDIKIKHTDTSTSMVQTRVLICKTIVVEISKDLLNLDLLTDEKQIKANSPSQNSH